MEIGMTLLGQALSFALLIWFTAKFIWPPLMAAIEARQQRIAEGLAAADRSQRDLAQAEDRVSELLREARDKSNEIIAQAESRAGQMVEKAKDDAIAEGQRQKELAQADIDAQSYRLREALRSEVSDLALAGAEKIVAREIDATTHRALLDELANSLQGVR